MKQSLLRLIVCPSCKENLASQSRKGNGDTIEEGQLICPKGHRFPITKGIPRMLVGELQGAKKKTADSFGFEWEAFSDMRAEWEKNFNFYFSAVGGSSSGGEPVNLSLFKESVALEVGCGNGRHTRYASPMVQELVSVDFSSAVDVALANNRQQSNIHFIQADIYHLPFRQGTFDFIFCLGVLHHLPTPEAGFKTLVNLLKNPGQILVYTYHAFPKTSFNFYLLGLVNLFRNITTRLPHRVLYVLCYPIAVLSYLVLVLPYKFFFKKFIKKGWPLGEYAKYSFFVMLNDTFDRFSAPIENRYKKEDMLAWFERAGLKNIKILGGSGWRVFGIKK